MSEPRPPKTERLDDTDNGNGKTLKLLRVVKEALDELERELAREAERRRRQLDALESAMQEFSLRMSEFDMKANMLEKLEAEQERVPANIADASAMILRSVPELDLQKIQVELQNRYNIEVERKILRTILDRWLLGKCDKPKFVRTKPSTYALFRKA